MTSEQRPPRFQVVNNSLIDCDAPTVSLNVPLLSQVINEIQRSAESLEMIMQTQAVGGEFNPLAGNYTVLLSKLEDALELEKQGVPLKGRCNVNLANVAQNFSEGFAYRFGIKTSLKVSVFTHHDIPAVSTFPSEIIRVIDGVVRGLRRFNEAGNVKIFLETLRIEGQPNSETTIVCSFRAPIPIPSETFSAHWKTLKSTDTPTSISQLGLELSAALHLANRLGAEAQLEVTAESGTTLQITFTMPIPPHHLPAPCFPRNFYFYSTHPMVVDQLTTLATFHGVTAYPVTSPTDVPPGEKLIYDATDYNGDTQTRLARLPRPEDTVVLLPVNELGILRQLSSLRFEHFVDYPLVSARVIRALMGFDPYKAVQSNPARVAKTKLRVLVVDDTMSARVLARDYLESLGHLVIEANDGSELIRHIEKGEHFDLIFCDQTMCHVDGTTAMKRVRKYEEAHNRRTPAVLVTMYTEIAAEEKAREAGFDQVLRKPLTEQMIDQMIAELVTTRSLPLRQTETVIVDLEDLKKRCSGRTKTMAKILGSFIDESKDSLSELKQHEVSLNKKGVGRTLHRIRGLLLTVGNTSGADIIAAIEVQLRNPEYLLADDMGRIEQMLGDTWNIADKLRAELTS